MYTVRFYIKPHLAVYMYHRYAQSIKAGAIHLPRTSILYPLPHRWQVPHCLQPSQRPGN